MMDIQKPIIFSTPMVQAILEGKKTQTRRVIKPQPDTKAEYKGIEIGKHVFETDIDMWHIKSPYQPGQVLWVRETWSMIDDMHVYRTDYGTTEDDSFPPSMFKWKSPIFMPKEAARIFLKVKNVRVERIQNMNFYDWQADFCPDISEQRKALAIFSGHSYMKQAMKDLWDNINAKRGYSWDKNPFVWVIEFERVNKP